LSEIICPTIAVESIGEVGSWFCNSSTRRLRKVVPVVVPAKPVPLAPVEVLLDVEVLPDAAAAALVFGVKRSKAEGVCDRPTAIGLFIVPPGIGAKVA
jgi:hypothetical protein